MYFDCVVDRQIIKFIGFWYVLGGSFNMYSNLEFTLNTYIYLVFLNVRCNVLAAYILILEK
jgi:hypothetical protein